jgi:MtN3 and saliva related transmembrane protein
LTSLQLDLIGYVAASLTTASFVPQAIKTFRTRDVSGISLGMYTLFTVGVALWLAYGVFLGAWPVIIGNVITLTLALGILLMKIKYSTVRDSAIIQRKSDHVEL